MDNTNNEEAVISILCQDGVGAYHEIAGLGITEDSFVQPTNKVLFKSLKRLFEDGINQPDTMLIVSAAQDIKYDLSPETSLIDQLFHNNVNIENIGLFAKKLKKLEIAKKMDMALKEAQRQIAGVDGSESISDICGIIEDKLANIFSFIDLNNGDPISFGDIVEEVIEDKINNPIDQIGIPTGFPIWDNSIGGGLRRHSIQLVGGRSKSGKSVFSKQVGINVAERSIPVLYLDTEMQTQDQLIRIIAGEAGVPIKQLETGQFTESIEYKKKVMLAQEKLKKIGDNFQHKVIAGEPFKNHLAVIKKWLVTHVGLTKEGKAKDCVIIYDYFKIMDSNHMNNLQEYQALGFMLSELHNFSVKFDVPMLASVQLNRDGVEKEDSSVISQSDRIAWLCSSFTIIKAKTSAEIAEDGVENGNQKLVPVLARYGPCLQQGDYIDVNFNRDITAMNELGTTKSSRSGGRVPKKSRNTKTKEKEKKIQVESPDFEIAPLSDEETKF